jgi:hypothetical protein
VLVRHRSWLLLDRSNDRQLRGHELRPYCGGSFRYVKVYYLAVYNEILTKRIAYLDGDGRDDYLYVGENGEVTAFRNAGPISFTDSLHLAKVNWIPSGIVASGVGAKRHEVLFADLNGDGRDDYLWVQTDGSVTAWINGGWTTQGDGSAKVNWLPQGVIASGIGMPGSSIRFPTSTEMDGLSTSPYT